MCLLVSLSAWHRWCHLGSGNLSWKNTSISLACRQDCGAFSWWRAGGVAQATVAVPLLSRWHGFYKKASRTSHVNKPISSYLHGLCFSSCPDFMMCCDEGRCQTLSSPRWFWLECFITATESQLGQKSCKTELYCLAKVGHQKAFIMACHRKAWSWLLLETGSYVS